MMASNTGKWVTDMQRIRKFRTHVILPDRLSPEQLRAALSIYRDTADTDYIAARRLWMSGLTQQFLWSSGQAIEKYLKAACLCNGMSATFSHEWFAKYEQLVSHAAQFQCIEPTHLAAPNAKLASLSAVTGLTYDESTRNFARRFNNAGQSAVRYNEFAWIDIEGFDLHKLDTFIRWIRGLCFPLDGKLDIDNSQSGKPEPALLGLRRLIEIYPDFAKANYAFFPDSSDDPIAWLHLMQSPYVGVFVTEQYDVVAWLKQHTNLTERALANLIQQFEAGRGRGGAPHPVDGD